MKHSSKGMLTWSLIWTTALSLSAQQAGAEDWPTYQHDNRRSAVTPEQLPPSLARIWTVETDRPKTAWAGPAKWDSFANKVNLKPMRNFDPVFYTTVARGRVFYGSSVDDAVHCLDVQTGQESWVFFTGGPARLPPTYHKGTVLFGSDDGHAYCVDARSGSLIWQVQAGPSDRRVPSNGKLISLWPCRTGVLVRDGIAYFAASLLPWETTYLCAVDAKTGALQGPGLYKRSMEQMTAQGPMLASADHLYVSQGRQAPLIFKRGDGQVIKSIGGSGFGGVYGLLTAEETLVHGHGQNHGVQGELRFFQGQRQDQFLTYPRATSIVIHGNAIYLHADGRLQAIVRDRYLQLNSQKAQKQRELNATRDKLKKLKDKTGAQAVSLEQQIKQGTQAVAQIDRQLPSCYQWKVNSDCALSLVLAGDTLYAGASDKVVAYDTATGRRRWQAPVNGQAHGLTVSHGRLLVSTDMGEIACFGSPAKSQVTALAQAHAHNDYYHKRPLLDALDAGFCSVEADIFLTESGELLVGHGRSELRPERTLQALYLDPLAERVRANGGHVHANGPDFTLLIDFKSEAIQTYHALDRVLQGYASMLTTVINGKVTKRNITVVISGNRAWGVIAADQTRYAGVDGRVGDLDSTRPVHLMPLISESWNSHFKWRGQGPMPEKERAYLRRFVARAHAQGRKVRFWATPDRPGPDRERLWTTLGQAGVNYLNTDDLPGLSGFLRKPAN